MKRSYIVATLFGVIVGLWILSGQFGADGNGSDAVTTTIAARQNGSSAPLPHVRVRHLTSEQRTRDLVLRGRTEATRWVDLRSETDGRIAEIVTREGQRVSQGDILVRLAPDDRRERLAEAKALVRQRQIEYDAASSLRDKGYRAETKLAESKALLESAVALEARALIELERMEIRAPFAGVVETRAVELGDYVKTGDAVARVVDEDPFLVVGQASELDVGQLQVGLPGSARLASGLTVNGRIRYIATVADEATRTFRVELEVVNPDRLLRAGATAEIRIPVETVSAQRLSPAALTLDDIGRLGVRTVGDSDIVAFAPIRIFSSDLDGVWVTGLGDRATVITVGQEFVRHGEKVVPVIDETAPSS